MESENGLIFVVNIGCMLSVYLLKVDREEDS